MPLQFRFFLFIPRAVRYRVLEFIVRITVTTIDDRSHDVICIPIDARPLLTRFIKLYCITYSKRSTIVDRTTRASFRRWWSIALLWIPVYYTRVYEHRAPPVPKRNRQIYCIDILRAEHFKSFGISWVIR